MGVYATNSSWRAMWVAVGVEVTVYQPMKSNEGKTCLSDGRCSSGTHVSGWR